MAKLEATVRLELGAATREAYGRALVALGESQPNVVVLDADLSKSTYTGLFGKKFPERFFNCGVLEQHVVGLAAGLASCGKTVFVSSFAVFIPGRCFDQLRVVVAQPRANVKVASSHAGLITGPDGKTAQALDDVALMRSLAGFTVIVPADEAAAAWAVEAAAELPGPVYIRLGRAKVPKVYPGDFPFRLGQAVKVRPGSDVTLVANGIMVAAALEAAASLTSEGISARVLDMHTVEPLDRESIAGAAWETGALVVAEEHFLHGGMGEAVARVVAEERPAPMEFVAVRQKYGISGEPEELLSRYHLTAADVATAARTAVSRKARSGAEK